MASLKALKTTSGTRKWRVGYRSPDGRSLEKMRFLNVEGIYQLAEAIDLRHRALVLAGAHTGCQFKGLAASRRPPRHYAARSRSSRPSPT